MARDQATLDALAGALQTLLAEPLAQLQGRRLDAEFFNAMLAPDATGLLLRWLSDPEGFRQQQTQAEWQAFCQQCKADAGFDPVKAGPLKAAGLLAARGNHWSQVWQRFAESPANYPGVVEWLKRAAPKSPGMFDSAETWPSINESEEQALKQALDTLADRPQDEVIQRLAELEDRHAERRRHPWQKLGLSPLATALAPLAQLAKLCATTPGAPTPEAYAAAYASKGWRVDAAALAAMAASGAPEVHGAVLGALRSVYLPWLDSTARHLQQLIHAHGQTVPRRHGLIEAVPGRLVVFADGLRMDVKFLRETGGIADSFSIDKSQPTAGMRPMLRVDRVPGALDFSWPTSLPTFQLESRTTPDPTESWLPIPYAPTLIGRSNFIRLELTPTNQFFRLRAEP